MSEQAPRSRHSGTPERDGGQAGRRRPRRSRIILTVVGGLLGPGYWLCGTVWDGRPFGKSSSEVHFTEFVLASIVVVVASWGLLLILGEALLFALAVFRADDKEQYDIYRNLMILWGYVLTLGIPRHYRKLPAQFGALHDDVRGEPRSGRQDGGHGHRDAPHAGDDRRSRERAPGKRTRESEGPRGRAGGRDRDDAREHTGCQERAQDRRGPWDQGDLREHAGCRKREATARRPASWKSDDTRDGQSARDGQRSRDDQGSRDRRSLRDQHDTREGQRSRDDQGVPARENARDRAGARRRERDRDVHKEPGEARVRPGSPQDAPKPEPSRKRPMRPVPPAATLDAAPRNPLGPIFPPRPAVEAQVTPVSPAVPAPAPVPRPTEEVPAPLTAGAVPTSPVPPAALLAGGAASTAESELRDALDLLLRYAARFHTEAPPPHATPGLGIAAEAAGGDA